MFYDTFMELCERWNTSPAQVRKELGISQSTMASWKSKDLTPNAKTLQKLASYFRVPVDYLLGIDPDAYKDHLLFQINTIKQQLLTAKDNEKEELENALFVLEESYADIGVADSLLSLAKENSKTSNMKIKDKISSWHSDKVARVFMCIDSKLLDLLDLFAKEDNLSLEDEIEKILYEDVERRIEETTD